MYTAKVENKNGDVLTLSGKEGLYQIINIMGLNPSSGQINTSTAAGMDGAFYNSSKLLPKPLSITIKLNGNVEENRLRLYNFFRTKEWCRFYYITETRNVYIDGYVEAVECNLFSRSEIVQIAINCLYPYFRSVVENQIQASNSAALFTFPFSINLDSPIPFSEYNSSGNVDVYNESESETGMTIEITVNNPVSTVQIRDMNSNDTITLNYPFVSNDKIIITTTQGQKSVTLIRGAEIINIFSAIQPGSSFLQLAAGINIFAYYANGVINSSKISLLFRYNNIYRGV